MSGAYYNENEPYAVAWLRNLIGAGLIPAGDVDERSILDVRSADLGDYNQCHFFAGIGGWAYALRLAGVPDDRPIWTGSCPCQPFSVAGSGKGTADERHLWPAFRGLIAECKPTVVFGEQVASADGRLWLAGVRADLEALGYGVGAADLCAAGISAPHIRQRLYWMADAYGQRRQQVAGGAPGHETAHGRKGRKQRQPDGDNVASSAGEGARGMADAASARRARGQDAGAGGEDAGEGLRGKQSERGRSGLADADNDEREQGERRGDRETQTVSRIDRAQERRPGELRGTGSPLFSGEWTEVAYDACACPICGDDFQECCCEWVDTADSWADAIRISCGDGKSRRIEPSISPLAHGVPARVGRLRAYGNAIVPPLAAEFVRVALS